MIQKISEEIRQERRFTIFSKELSDGTRKIGFYYVIVKVEKVFLENLGTVTQFKTEISTHSNYQLTLPMLGEV